MRNMSTTKTTYRSRRWLAACLLLMAAACRKEEFQQPPHGSPVPVADTAHHDVRGLLALSSHKLFEAAWKRSHMDQVLSAQAASVRFTILAPDDAAMAAAGFNAAGIAAATPEQLDTLLQFHVITEQLDTVALRLQLRSLHKKTLLTHPVLMEHLNPVGSAVTNPYPYTYKHYVGTDAAGILIVDGKHTGHSRPMFAKNGVIWPLNRVLEMPRMSVMEYLESDPRFSMFVAITHWCDNVWSEISMDYFQRKIFKNLKPDLTNVVVQDAFFAPTNDAFKAAGIESVDDLIALNMRSMPYIDWDWFEVRNGFVTDSLLSYHALGRIYEPLGTWGAGAPVPAVFYSNDLNPGLSSFTLNVSDGSVKPFYLPLVFGTAGGRVTVAPLAGGQTATVTEADINTFQGPVHVVDRIMVPANLRLK